MDFQLSSAQTDVTNAANTLCAKHCTVEQERERDLTGQFPEALYRDMATSHLLSVWPDAATNNEYLTACSMNEALARYSSTAASIAFVSGVCAAIISAGRGPEADNLLEGMQRGELVLAFGMTESTAGSDPSLISTTAERNGNSEFTINGQKHYTTGAREADYILTVVRSGEGGHGHAGVSVIAVPRLSKGLTVEPMEKIAGNAHASCIVTFDNVSVSDRYLIGTDGGAWKLLFLGSFVERLAVASSAVGMAQQALDEISAYLRERKSGGQPVSSYQAIQHQLVDLNIRLSAMRALLYQAAWKAGNGLDAVADINMAKVYCVENCHRITTEAMRLQGASAYLKGSTIHRLCRESTLGFYAAGTNEIARNTAAKALNF